jgi:hypothetical protein
VIERKSTLVVAERYAAQLRVTEGLRGTEYALVDQDERPIVGPCRSEALLEEVCFRLARTSKSDIPTLDQVLIAPWVRL